MFPSLDFSFNVLAFYFKTYFNLMDWNVKFDDEIRIINCVLFAFQFQNSSVFIKTMDILDCNNLHALSAICI